MTESQSITLLALASIPVSLTIGMVATKNFLLGFPSAIFWAVLGAFSWGLSTATWDWQYVLFFTSLMGMIPFCVFGAWGLRKNEFSQSSNYSNTPDNSEDENREFEKRRIIKKHKTRRNFG